MDAQTYPVVNAILRTQKADSLFRATGHVHWDASGLLSSFATSTTSDEVKETTQPTKEQTLKPQSEHFAKQPRRIWSF